MMWHSALSICSKNLSYNSGISSLSDNILCVSILTVYDLCSVYLLLYDEVVQVEIIFVVLGLIRNLIFSLYKILALVRMISISIIRDCSTTLEILCWGWYRECDSMMHRKTPTEVRVIFWIIFCLCGLLFDDFFGDALSLVDNMCYIHPWSEITDLIGSGYEWAACVVDA